MLSHTSRFRVDGLLLLVALSWGSTYAVAKELVLPGSVLALLSVRMLVASVLMIALVARRGGPSAKELRVGLLLGILLSAVFLLETFGIAYTSATNAGVIISLTIVFTPILESVTSRLQLPIRFWLAAAGAVVGVVLLAGGGMTSAPTVGDALVLLAAIVRAVHVTSMQHLTVGVALDSARLTAVQLVTCAAVFTVASGLAGESVPEYLVQLKPTDVALVLYLAVVCTVFAFFVQLWAVRRTSPTRVSLLLGTEPVWAAAIGLTIAGDALGANGWIGLALIIVATVRARAIETRQRRAMVSDTRVPNSPIPVRGPPEAI